MITSQIEIYRFIDGCDGKIPEILGTAMHSRMLGLDEILFLSQVMKLNLIESSDPENCPKLEDISHRVCFLDTEGNKSI
jgi:hypothetical protein